MTVYNITKILNNKQQQAIRLFLGADVLITFSDWFYDFNIRKKNKNAPINKHRIPIVIKRLHKLLGHTPIPILLEFPEISAKEK